MDMSGSITDSIAEEFLSEVNGILNQFDDYKIDIWTFDTEVYNHAKFSSDGGDSIESYVPKGGGGTSFECNWEYMKNNEMQPKIFIMFTDLCPCDGWGDPDYCDTIFVSRGNKGAVAPFGLTVEMD
jgi:predicted metal-dependent peptidase